VTTTLPESSISQIVRKADLSLTSDGSLEGKLTVTFTGLEAQWRRVQERNEDEAHRKKLLEDYVKEIVPVGIEVELVNKPEWTSSAPSLVAEYTLKVPGWVAGATDAAEAALFCDGREDFGGGHTEQIAYVADGYEMVRACGPDDQAARPRAARGRGD